MNLRRRLWPLMILASLGLIGTATLTEAAPACSSAAHCVETRSFTATISNFRISKQGRTRVLTVTVRIQNRGASPLIVGYVAQSGVALDDQGNRYVVPGSSAIRAIGEISGSRVDPKFALQPGEGSDARFELVWDPGNALLGTTYELDLALREIIPAAGGQFRMGSEHALHFDSLGEMTRTPGMAKATASADSAAVAPSVRPPPPDPCAGASACFNAGSFIAEVQNLTASAMTPGARHHSLTVNVRFRNVSDKPLVLAYRSVSSAGIDNFGNRFVYGRPGTHDTSVRGIGYVDARSADPQFVLNPGQSRSATFGLIRFNAVPPIGESFNFDVVIDELEILPGQQIRSARQNSLSFTNLAPGAFAASASAGSSNSQGDAIAGKVLDLFNQLKKK